jgi:hypothetical protein
VKYSRTATQEADWRTGVQRKQARNLEAASPLIDQLNL